MENRIKYIRKAKGLTQTELAKKAGTAQSHIAMIEIGERGLDFDLAYKIAKALDVKTYELLPLEEQPEKLSDDEQEVLTMWRKQKKANTNTNPSSNETKAG